MVNGVLASLVIRVPLAWALTRLFPDNLMGIGSAAPAATVLSILLGLLFIRTGRWRRPQP